MFAHAHAAGGPGGPPSEATLFAQAQAGCAECLNRLMAHHDGLVQAVVRQQVLGDLPFSEALQAGRIGLWRAVLGFDPSRGMAFSTYAWPCIKHPVWRAVKRHARLLCEEREALPWPEAPDPAAVWEAQATRRALQALVRRLPPRLEYVVVARYGLNGHPPFFYRQIGAALGLTGERARQLHTEALVRLRHPAHSYLLRSLLGRHTLADYEAADAQAQRWLRQRRGGHHGRYV
jgi:RNA polymerase sigma factor (sigma-70 family)